MGSRQNRQEDIKMDRPEIVARRGYETFAEHYVNVGIEKGLEKGRIEMALDMLADNEPVEKIVKYTHLSKEKVLELQNK